MQNRLLFPESSWVCVSQQQGVSHSTPCDSTCDEGMEHTSRAPSLRCNESGYSMDPLQNQEHRTMRGRDHLGRFRCATRWGWAGGLQAMNGMCHAPSARGRGAGNRTWNARGERASRVGTHADRGGRPWVRSGSGAGKNIGGRHEQASVVRPVVPVRMRNKVGPKPLAEAGSHDLCDPGGRGAYE